MPNRRCRFALVALLAAPAACEMPRFQGPQIQSPPANFVIVEDNYQDRRMFADRDIGFHTAWVHSDVSGVSVIYVNGHSGSTTLDEVIAAQEIARAAATDPDLHFSGVEPVTIDGQDGWGWAERVESERRGLVQVGYRAVVPYDTVSYTIEFVSGEPTLKISAPDTLRAIVASFGVGRTTLNLPLIMIGTGALLLLIAQLRARAQARASRLRTINLVQVPKPDKDEEEGAPSKADAPLGAAGDPAGGRPTPPPPPGGPAEGGRPPTPSGPAGTG